MGDVASKRVTAAGAITDRRTRVTAVSAVGAAGAGRLTLTDGNGGTTLLDVDIPTGVGATLALFIGDDGIMFKTNVYAATVTATGVTIFYSS